MTTTLRKDKLNEVKLTGLNVTEVELDFKQRMEWEQCRAKFLIEAPAFAHILYTMMNPKRQAGHAIFTKEIPIAATDGLYMYLNPETFFKYSLPQRVFIMAHEVAHCMLNHLHMSKLWRDREKVPFTDGTSLPYDHALMGKAMDYVINDMLIQGKDDKGKAIGEFPLDGLHDPSLITYMDSIADAYRKVYKQNKQGGGKGPGRTGPGGVKGRPGGGFDEHLEPGKAEGQSATQAANERSDSEWATAVAGAIALAKAQGKLPGSLARIFGEILEPRVPWQEYIHGFFRRRLGSAAWDWRRADRRLISRSPMIYAPARSGYGCGAIAVAIDTSGSIDKDTLDMFMGEVSGILSDVNPQRVYLMWCDAKLHRVDEVEDVSDLLWVREKGAPGGGGTSFVPVFDHVHELPTGVDALVYLTDGYGTFPHKEPEYPVLWGSIGLQPEHYPWGEVVMIPRVQ